MIKINLLYAGDTNQQEKASRFFGRWRLLLALVVSVLLLGPAVIHSANGPAIAAPTILVPATSEIITKPQPYIRGVTPNNTLVDVYIDGIFNGRAKVKNHPSGTASWAYQIFLPLELGQHEVHAVTLSADEIFHSPQSRSVSFSLEKPLVQPSALSLEQNLVNWQKPIISGQRPADVAVEIFIDGVLAKTLESVSSQAEEISFQYEPSQNLAAGWHSIKARATDPRGKYSAFTQPLIVEIREQGVTPLHAPALVGENAGQPSGVPAPTLLRPENSSVGSRAQPAIVGLAHSHQYLQIFIDETLNGELRVGQHSSGVAGFAYSPFLPLTAGEHTAYARAIDDLGKASAKSNTLSFFIRPASSSFIVTEIKIKTQKTDITVEPSSIPQTAIESEQDSPETAADQVIQEMTEAETLAGSQESKTTETEPTTDEATADVSSEAMNESAEAEADIPKDIMSAEETTTDIAAEAAVSGSDEDSDDQAAGRIVVGSNPRVGAGSINILLIIVLAVAVVIIVGVISWLTTKPKRNAGLPKIIEYIPSDSSAKTSSDPAKTSEKNSTSGPIPPPPDVRS